MVEEEKGRKFNILYDKNNQFLSKLSFDEHKKLFLALKDYAVIEYAKEPFYHPELSEFYNDFFSTYDSIQIDEYETYKICKSYISLDDHYLPNILSIGKDMSDLVYIKKNDPLNNIYIETLDLEDSINSDSPGCPNIYHFLIHHISCEYNLDLEIIWNDLQKFKM